MGQDLEPQGEALHLICLLHLFFGRIEASKALKGVALGSLEDGNAAAQLLRSLKDQEGEATALLSIAEARLLEPNLLEAQGAARRALELFRSLRHRRGRSWALRVMAKALPTLETLELVEEELRVARQEQDRVAQLDALRQLAEVYAEKRPAEARSALRRALELAEGTEEEAKSGSKGSEALEVAQNHGETMEKKGKAMENQWKPA